MALTPKALGVEWYTDSACRCLTCGAVWSPCMLLGGRLPARWWLCVNECNARG